MAQVLENARGDRYTLPRSLFITGFDRPRTLQVVTGGNGSTPTRNARAPARGTLEGVLHGKNYAAAQAALDDLLAFLHHTPIRVRLHGETGRYLEVHPEGVSDAGSSQGRLPSIRVPLIATDPLWVGDAASDGPRSISSATLFEVTNAGNAPTAVKLTLTGTSALRPKIENLTTGQSAELLLSVSTGNTWVFDGKAHGLTVNDDPANDAASNAFLVGGFSLAPGVNEVRAERQSGAFMLSLEWVERWY